MFALRSLLWMWLVAVCVILFSGCDLPFTYLLQ